MTDGSDGSAKTFKSLSRKIAVSAAILGLLWLLPPYFHDLRRLCPVRPDGVSQALGLPAFARKYKMSCSQCHADYPTLNAYGRQFKMNGYVRTRGSTDGVLQSQNQELWTEATMPWAVIVRSRPLDTGHGTATTGSQMGGTGPLNGPEFQPINDIDMFIAGGDAAKHVSYFGEMDANQAAGFNPSMGDLRFGYHPSLLYNVVLMRRGFFVDDPYQTITSAESPTIANRSTDFLMEGQAYLSGFPLNTQTQTGEIYGQVHISSASPSFAYYALGYSKDPSSNNTGQGGAGNAYARFAYDTGNGLMLGTFGQYGQSGGPGDAGAPGSSSYLPGGGQTCSGGACPPGGVGTPYANHYIQSVRGGVDALWEHNDFYARAAYVYAHDSDATMGAAESDQAAYAELFYTYKRDYNGYAFLVPLIRENWLTLWNGTEQFNYVTAQLAHYFAPNFKGFVEYTVDTNRSYGSGLADVNTGGTGIASVLPMGNRLAMQLEVGF